MKVLSLLTAITGIARAIPSPFKKADTASCPYYLPEGGYEFPHLIVPINSSNVAMGHSYFADISPSNGATIYNFDIPPSRAHQQCSLYFTFPRHNQLSTSDYQWTGNNNDSESAGTLQAVQYQYATGATDSTTGNTQPALGLDAPITINSVTPGNAYKIWTGLSGAGGVMSWRLSSTDSWLHYFQDWNLCAIGLWVVYEGAAPAPVS
ncbi:hypothetical protein H2198_003356 [Neophaeococcomyces mojaviensis]|uniref:Uncharacterized protein n=1 Tax=Neophaeococcomyces mojaviensis TaxID=3383035 RepID=A0ACC3AC25_9EURO|nr:hypothetical protein H2198_003356 [Knufia sp. JES_112]